MAVLGAGPGAPDHSMRVVGDKGDPLSQESGSGKQVFRRGGDSSAANVDIGSKGSGIDVATSAFHSTTKDAGGAEALAGKLSSADATSAFNVEIDWKSQDGSETLITTSKPALQSATGLEFNLIMRSDKYEVRVSGVSGLGSAKVNGSINAH